MPKIPGVNHLRAIKAFEKAPKTAKALTRMWSEQVSGGKGADRAMEVDISVALPAAPPIATVAA